MEQFRSPLPSCLKGKIMTTEELNAKIRTTNAVKDNGFIEGDLYLYRLTSIPEGFNPTVGGDLYLSSLTSIPEGFSPTVGGSLDLYSLTSIPESFAAKALTIYCRNIDQRWNGIRLLSVDGEVMRLLSQHEVGDVTVYRAEYWGGDKCVIAKVGDYYAHGETVREAVSDANFKRLQATVNVDQIVAEVKSTQRVTREHYRLLTGACKLGTERFLESHGLTGEASIPLDQCREIVRGAYGGERFCELFA